MNIIFHHIRYHNISIMDQCDNIPMTNFESQCEVSEDKCWVKQRNEKSRKEGYVTIWPTKLGPLSLKDRCNGRLIGKNLRQARARKFSHKWCKGREEEDSHLHLKQRLFGRH